MDLRNQQIKDTYGNLATINTSAGTPTTGVLQNGAGSNVTSLTIEGTLNATNVDATNLTGTLATAAQTNITSVGTLTGLGVSGTTGLDGAVTINNSEANVDFRVAGDTETNLLFVDASTDRIGIGTSSPYTKLSVSQSESFTYSPTNTVPTLSQDEATISLGNTGPMMIRLVTSQGGGTGIGTINLVTDGTSVGTNMTFATRNNASGNTPERLRITSSGEVLIGGTTSINAAQGCLTLQRLNDQPLLSFYRNDTSVSGNSFGDIYWYGNDTTSNTPTLHARISAFADGTHSAGDNPTDLVFYNTAGSSATATERMRLDKNGYLRLATGGIQFNGDTAAANALDDYEEGTFTATLKGSVSDPTTPLTSTARYTKIGNKMFVAISFASVDTTGASGNVSVTGLPISPISFPFVGSCLTNLYDYPSTSTSPVVYLNNSTTLSFYVSGDSIGFQTLQHSAGAGRWLVFNITYFVA